MNVAILRKKYRGQLEDGDILSLVNSFHKLDVDDRGYIDEATAIKSAQNSERQPYDVVRQALKEVELDSSRRVELNDYVDLIARLKQSSPAQQRLSTGPQRPQGATPAPSHASKASVGGTGGRITLSGATASSQHTINEDERTAFTSHVNAVLAGDPDIGHLLPFPLDTSEMFVRSNNGLVLAKLINDSVPDTIDERVLNRPKGKELNTFQMTENNNIVIESAKGIGCSVVNVGAQDIIEGKDYLILGLIWQIIRRGLLGKIDIKLHPELYRLLEDGETLEQFLRLPPEQILLRWFNYHLKNAKWHRRVQNFSNDVKDGENYTVLLNQLAPNICSRSPLQTSDLLQRAEQVLQNSDRLDPPCRKFLTPTSLVAGNPKLNLAFVANLFNNHPGLEPITEEEKAEIEDFDAEGEREARVFTLWLNSLGVNPTVVSFFDDLKDGIILLQAYDKIVPGSVNWRHVAKPPANAVAPVSDDPDEAHLTIKSGLMRVKALQNTNYAVELGKQNGFSLVGIQGADLTDVATPGQRTLALGLVWQLMRKDIANTLASLARRMGKREISDPEVVEWVNSMVGPQGHRIRSLKDSSLPTALPMLDVLAKIKSNYVDYALVAKGTTDDERYQNAKLAISIARKMGATIWLVPEDITSLRSRLIFTFFGSLMAVAENAS